MTWIRWDTATPQSDVIGCLAQRLRLPLAQALGHYNATCCGFGEHRPDGLVREVSDELLEQWALWRGRPGRWAAAFRSRCSDDSGYLRGWWRQEKLLAKRERDAAKRKPATNPQKTPDKPALFPLETPAANGRTDGRSTDKKKKTSAPDGAGHPPWAAEIFNELIRVGKCTYGSVGGQLKELHDVHGELLVKAAGAYRRHKLAEGLRGAQYARFNVVADFANRAGVYVEQERPGSGVLPNGDPAL